MSGGGFESVDFSNREKVSGGRWRFSFVVPESSPYFKEHFESFRLLPAVAEIDIAVRCASGVLERDISVTALKKTKFISPVLPGSKMILELDFRSGGSIGFTFFTEKGDKASFGVIYYSI